MKRVYLDNNIFIYIENKSIKTNSIGELIDSKKNKYFYSAAHIQEADEIKAQAESQRKAWINKRMQTIEEITKSNYLYYNLSDKRIYELHEKPHKVLETIREVPFAKTAIKSFLNLVSNEQKIQTRNFLGLDAGKMNNYAPSEVVEHLTKKLNTNGVELSFLELIEKGITVNPQGKEFGLINRFAAIFEMLDMLGFWTDKYNEKSNYARLWDSNHAFFASFCDYFISNDKRTRNKAKVVYEIYNIETQVISHNKK